MNRSIRITGGLLAIILIIALVAPLVSPYEYDQTNFDALLQPPSVDGFRLFGTDVSRARETPARQTGRPEDRVAGIGVRSFFATFPHGIDTEMRQHKT